MNRRTIGGPKQRARDYATRQVQSASPWMHDEVGAALVAAYLAGYRSAAVRNRLRPLVVHKQNIDALITATRAAITCLTHDERATLLDLFTNVRST